MAETLNNINYIEWDRGNRQYLIRLAGDEQSQESRLSKMKVAEEMYEALKQIASCESYVVGDVVDIARKILAKAEGK